MSLLPAVIDTPRLRLRPWRRTDAEAFNEVMAANNTFLSRWMIWALDEPSPLAVTRDRLEMFGARFDDGREWICAIESRGATSAPPIGSPIGSPVAPVAMPAPDLLGGVGVHPRDASERIQWSTARGVPTTLEIGYWLRHEVNGHGLCTEAVRALLDTLRERGVRRIEIRTHPDNHASRAIPRRLGLHVERVEPAIIAMPDGSRAPGEIWV